MKNPFRFRYPSDIPAEHHDAYRDGAMIGTVLCLVGAALVIGFAWIVMAVIL